MNKQHVTLLVLLDLSAAFDTVDHNVLLSRLHSKFGISGTALEWFRSYLNGRSQRVMVQGNLSQSLNLDFGVPQGSCLGPLLFTIYASKLSGDRSFAAAPQLWNSLPYAIRSSPSVASFKKTLKAFLFQKAFFVILCAF